MQELISRNMQSVRALQQPHQRQKVKASFNCPDDPGKAACSLRLLGWEQRPGNLWWEKWSPAFVCCPSARVAVLLLTAASGLVARMQPLISAISSSEPGGPGGVCRWKPLGWAAFRSKGPHAGLRCALLSGSCSSAHYKRRPLGGRNWCLLYGGRRHVSPARMGAEKAFLGNVSVGGAVSALDSLSLGPGSPQGLSCLRWCCNSTGLCSHSSTENEGPNFVCMLSLQSRNLARTSLVFLCSHRLKLDSKWLITVGIHSLY